MSEKRKLAYRDRYVRYLSQTLSDRFDNEPQFPTLPFVDLTSRVPLVYRVNAREYTQIYSAIMTGGDLAFPDIAHELELIWAYPDLFEPEEDTCLDYATSDSSIITFAPQDPHTQPGYIPEAYIMSPFWLVSSVTPEFLPDWFADLIEDIITEFTGYLPTDVLCTIGSLPISLDLEGILALITDGLPRFTITVEGAGELELHLLSVPLGGRLLVSIDVEFDIMDIINGIITDGFNLIELERDYSSTPPEIDATHIEEIILTTSGTHTIYCTFIPVLDLDAFPIKFGGGIRQIVWCSDNIPDPECPECTIEVVLDDEVFFEEEYLPTILGDIYTETIAHNEVLNTAWDGTEQSIGADIPTGIPDDSEDFALCAAIVAHVKLYSIAKLSVIQSKNFLEVAWNNLLDAANGFYESLTKAIAFIYTPNLYSCFVDDTEAMTVLADMAAQEELACFLLDDLSNHTMTLTNYDDALTSATTSLTGNAQKLACIMQQDNSLTVYINFLEAYQLKLNETLAGNDIDCPCLSGTYRIYRHEFINGMGRFKFAYSGDTQLGSLVDGRIKGTQVGTSQYAIGIAWDDFNPDWRIDACRLEGERINGQGSGTVDSDAFNLRPYPYQTTSQIGMISGGFRPNGVYNRCANRTSSPFYWTGGQQAYITSNVAYNGGTGEIYLDAIEIAFVDGFHYSGYPTTDSDICT